MYPLPHILTSSQECVGCLLVLTAPEPHSSHGQAAEEGVVQAVGHLACFGLQDSDSPTRVPTSQPPPVRTEVTAHQLHITTCSPTQVSTGRSETREDVVIILSHTRVSLLVFSASILIYTVLHCCIRLTLHCKMYVAVSEMTVALQCRLWNNMP